MTTKKDSTLFFPEQERTICALATPPGEGALSLIRMSGPASFKIARKLCPFLPTKIKSHRLYFGHVLHPRSQKPLDEALVSCFKQGRSFTGEESVEFNCHGGHFIAQNVLSALNEAGARMAKKGEFSYRAFMNGKMDLIQAESVLTLIQSRSLVNHAQALSALKGNLSNKLSKLEKKLMRLLSHIEASLDFSEEDISPFDIEKQKSTLKEIQSDLTNLLKGFEQGLINREGFCVLLTGAPNAGKSSLFNHLLKEDKAIVTPLPGTTRDVLSASLLWHGREFTFKDSAGLRPHPDLVEKEGIKKAQAEIKKTDLLLFLVESHLPLKKESFFGLDQLDRQKTVICFSKADLLPEPKQRQELLNQARRSFPQNLSFPRAQSASRESLQCETQNLANKQCLPCVPPDAGAGISSMCGKKSRSKNSEAPFVSAKQALLADSAVAQVHDQRTVFTMRPPRHGGDTAGWISAHTGEGVEDLKKFCFKKSEKTHGEDFFFTPRQGQALKDIALALNRASRLLRQKASPDLVAFELKEGLSYLKQLTGRQYKEEVIQGIFKEFCLGK